MYSRVRRTIAVFLCVIICMTNVDIYAAEENEGGIEGGIEAGIEAGKSGMETESSLAEETIESEAQEQESETESEIMNPETGVAETSAEEETSEHTRTENTESETAGSSFTGEEAVETTEEMTGETTETEVTETTEAETAVTEEFETGEFETGTFEAETMEEETEDSITEILSELQSELDRQFQEDGYSVSGFVDSGFEADRLAFSDSSLQLYGLYTDREGLPEAYSAVAHGQVSSVKNQGAWGTCWAFSALAPAESAYKRLYGSESDLSETHLVNFFYHDGIAGPDGGLEGDQIIPLTSSKVMQGGNSVFTTFALSRWTGVADEAMDKSLVYPLEESYNTKELKISDEYAYSDVLHMQNAYWINKEDHDSIKREVMEKGAVSIFYKYSSSNDSRYVDTILEKYGKDKYDGPAVYFYQPMNNEEAHGVSIVGWDDNFDRNNFAYTFLNQQDILAFESKARLPEENGAWLVKNSWGSEYGDDGYFWMSYEDASLSDTIVSFDFEKADNYDHIYQYDGSAGVRYESGDTVTAAAVYKSTGNQIIEAAGIGIASVETDYTVEVYTGLTDINDPQSGRLSSRTTGKSIFQGYHTIVLDECAVIAEDDIFSIVVTLSNGTVNGEKGAAIFMDQSYENGNAVRFAANARPGETFRRDGSGWRDIAGEGTYRIKAYTTDGVFDVPSENRELKPEMVKEIEDQEYSGVPGEPPIEIRYMGEALIRDVDYNVEYINNSMAADKNDEAAPRAVITGIGKYTGTVEQTFTILRKNITEEMVGSATMAYNGAVQDDLTLKNGDSVLVKGIDYTISFNRQPCSVGNYTAVITGMNNYTGELTVPVTIAKTTISEDMVVTAEGSEDIAAQEYTGTAVKPAVRVVVNGVELPSGSYSVSYKNNTSAGGAAVVTVTGKGNCQGKVTKTFEITPKNIETDCTVTIAKAVYSGKALTPAVTVKWGKKTLKKGKDYNVTYANNLKAADQSDADSPVAVITGMGNYTGRIEQKFSIQPKEIAESSIGVQIAYGDKGNSVHVFAGKTRLSQEQYNLKLYKAGTTSLTGLEDVELGVKYDAEVELLGNYKVKGKACARRKNIVCRKDISELDIRFADETTVCVYNAKAYKPKLVIKDQNGNAVSNSGYTISYTDNINAGTAKVVITGKGVYAGTKQLLFTIQKKTLKNITISAIKDQTYTGKAICPSVKIKGDGITLKAGKDYTVAYGSNTNVSYNSNGELTAGAYAEIQLSDNYEISDQVSITGQCRIAEGTKDKIFVGYKIVPAKISTISLSKAYYTGQAVLPDEITVKAGKLEVPVDCYEIAAENNIWVSSRASLTVTAKPEGNFTGSKTKKFSIVKLELKKLILPVIPDQPYLNRPVTVEGYDIKNQEGQTVDAGQYDVIIKNNTKPGKAAVTYKAKSDGLYKGSATVRFNITKATMEQAVDDDAACAIEKQYTGGEITLSDEELRKLAPIKDAADGYQLPYTAAYSKNINAGRAVITLTGTGYLHGSKNVYFTIMPKSASAFEITTGPKRLSYNNGSPVYLELEEVKDNDTVLKAGKDFTCSYTNADKRGVACLTVTGVGNYSGTRYIYYNID